jgi:hypothetical protein
MLYTSKVSFLLNEIEEQLIINGWAPMIRNLSWIGATGNNDEAVAVAVEGRRDSRRASRHKD